MRFIMELSENVKHVQAGEEGSICEAVLRRPRASWDATAESPRMLVKPIALCTICATILEERGEKVPA